MMTKNGHTNYKSRGIKVHPACSTRRRKRQNPRVTHASEWQFEGIEHCWQVANLLSSGTTNATSKSELHPCSSRWMQDSHSPATPGNELPHMQLLHQKGIHSIQHLTRGLDSPGTVRNKLCTNRRARARRNRGTHHRTPLAQAGLPKREWSNDGARFTYSRSNRINTIQSG